MENTKKVLEILNKKNIINKDERGFYYTRPYIDYEERASLEECVGLEENLDDAIDYILDEYYYPYDTYILDSIELEIQNHWEEIKKELEINMDIYSFIDEFYLNVYDLFYVDYAEVEEIIRDAKYGAYLTISTYEDRNSDNTLLSDISQALADDDIDLYNDLIHQSGLKLLIESQGYKTEDLFNNIDSKFISSLRNELNNATNYINNLVIPCMISREDYEKLYKNEDAKIIISPNAVVGIISFDVGGGSVLGVELEKPVELFGKDIKINRAWDDKEHQITILSSKDVYYGLEEIYGIPFEDMKYNVEIISQ